MDTRNEAWEKIVDALEKGDVEKLAELREILPDAVGDASRLLDALSFAASRPDRALIEATLHGLQEEFTQERRTRLARWIGTQWARLVADSLHPSFAAVRSRTSSADRTLVYQAGGQTISVSLADSPRDPEGRWRMRGAVLSSAGPVAGGSITVFRGDDALDAEEVEAFPIDPLGTFHLETARADRTFLEVRTGTHSTETVALVGPIPPADSE